MNSLNTFNPVPINHLYHTIINAAKPHPELLAKHPGNWPASSEYAVEYNTQNKNNPSINYPLLVCYFDDEMAMEEWFLSSRICLKESKGDFTIIYTSYSWDLGPKFLNSGCL